MLYIGIDLGTSAVKLLLRGESVRIFPLSNWTELDIWQYIRLEKIQVVVRKSEEKGIEGKLSWN